jgi:hypothetical protein
MFMTMMLRFRYDDDDDVDMMFTHCIMPREHAESRLALIIITSAISQSREDLLHEWLRRKLSGLRASIAARISLAEVAIALCLLL